MPNRNRPTSLVVGAFVALVLAAPVVLYASRALARLAPEVRTLAEREAEQERLNAARHGQSAEDREATKRRQADLETRVADLEARIAAVEKSR